MRQYLAKIYQIMKILMKARKLQNQTTYKMKNSLTLIMILRKRKRGTSAIKKHPTQHTGALKAPFRRLVPGARGALKAPRVSHERPICAFGAPSERLMLQNGTP